MLYISNLILRTYHFNPAALSRLHGEISQPCRALKDQTKVGALSEGFTGEYPAW